MALPGEVMTPILAYAARLHRVFSRLGVLAGTGIQADRQFHAAVRLYRCDPADERVRNYRQSDMVVAPWGQQAAKARGHLTSVEAEAPALARWVSSGHKSLLILAPFGAGKSVVLETFARSLSAGLLAADREPPDTPLVVPLPVRLRAWKWHEGEPFEAFLWRSQTLLDGDSRDGLLPPEVFRSLIRAGLLLPLLDGLDELPGGYDCRDGNSPRERALGELRRLMSDKDGAPCRAVVASRPGYGVENDALFARDDRLSISEYTESEIRAYIASRFATAEERETLAAAVRAFSRAEPDIREILSRPLFLAAWCDRVACAPGSAPQSVTDIMRVLVARTI